MTGSAAAEPKVKRNIAVVGFRCTGKTVTGSALAEHLGFEYCDTDKIIEERAGKSIARIFEDDGEAAFRALEVKVIAEVCAREDVVISAGGGAPMNPRNLANIRRACFVAVLTADVETILRRMESDPETDTNRPALTGMGMRREIEHLLSVREDAYHAAGDIEIDTSNRTIGGVVRRIVDEFQHGSF